jgi:hypothetical protein
VKTAIIGGGAAGFFCAINLKEMVASMEVTIFERAQKVLRKVEISGGGRCNCTNTFAQVSDLSQVYPRGHKLMKRLMKGFSERDAFDWFERHGVALTVQEDECVFPRSQDSHTIINLFLSEARRLGIKIQTGQQIDSFSALSDYDFIVVTTGGSPKEEGIQWLGHEIVKPVPSLFTFNIEDHQLRALMGTVVNATLMIPGTKMRASGALLVTHWGLSGPVTLCLSSYAARLLAENNYQLPLNINWVSRNDAEVQQELTTLILQYPQKRVSTLRPFSLPSRLWEYLSEKCLGRQRADIRWQELSKKEQNRLITILTADNYQIAGRAAFKDEFVTCGGIALSAIDPATLESKSRPGLYFAGEVLDIDGVTGGFNFQAAWTTAHTVCEAIVKKAAN